ncbi:uncharacterized protein CIMG_13416 [Coccidioides immitis RS]|uniref:Uncharacterized protein n=1 Tax=Coccidioides immitis (strain RS) TaxID=246410 RepID=A0A0D8JUW7_COCIM|nr:uncharacterized protein CIMG_13416 [Coccidioides immitis RS]KJF61100.1 hypothetical protein CIMG_13416 [Coccidioides immitis RS]
MLSFALTVLRTPYIPYIHRSRTNVPSEGSRGRSVQSYNNQQAIPMLGLCKSLVELTAASAIYGIAACNSTWAQDLSGYHPSCLPVKLRAPPRPGR